MGRFLLVEFLIDNTVAIVPDNWEKSGECRWPPNHIADKMPELNKLVRSFAPPEDSWLTYQSRILTSSSHYSKVAKKLKRSEVTSDLNITTDAEVEGGKKTQDSINLPVFIPRVSEIAATRETIPEVFPKETVVEVHEHVQNIDNEKSLRKILKEIEGIKETQRTLIRMMTEIKAASEEKTTTVLPTNCPTLPVGSADDLGLLNTFLNNQGDFAALVTYLGSIGGFNVRDVIRRILSAILTNKLSTQYNWRGNGTKLPFSVMANVTKLVLASVRSNSTYRDVTEHEVFQNIKKWLMHAKDRDGGRAKRAKEIPT